MTKIKKANYVGNFMGFGTSFDGAVYGRGGVARLSEQDKAMCRM